MKLSISSSHVPIGRLELSAGSFFILFLGTLSLLYVDFFERATGVRWLGYMDDAAVALFFLLLILHSLREGFFHKVGFVWALVVIGLLVISIPSPFFRGFFVSAVSTILYAKIFLIFILGKKVSICTINKLIRWLSVVHILGFTLNILFASYFKGLLPQVSYELDISRVIGFEVNANRFAAASALFALYYWHIERRKPLFVVMLASMFMANSRSFVALFLMAFTYYSLVSDRFKHQAAISSIVLLLGVSMLVWFAGIEEDIYKIANTVDGDLKYIRATMLLGGWLLAAEYFPFGTGAGTFGSALSHGSAVYGKLGIAHWLSVDEGTGIHDSGVGSLLGEYGFLGSVIVLYALWKMFDFSGQKVLRLSDLVFMILIVVVLSFFRGVVSSFFYSIIIFGLFVICYQIRSIHSNKLRV